MKTLLVEKERKICMNFLSSNFKSHPPKKIHLKQHSHKFFTVSVISSLFFCVISSVFFSVILSSILRSYNGCILYTRFHASNYGFYVVEENRYVENFQNSYVLL